MKSTDELISEIPAKEKDDLLMLFFNRLIDRHPQPWRVERDWGYDIVDSNNREVIHCLRSPEFADFIIDFAAKFDAQSKVEYEEIMKEATGENNIA